jgi:hypothetical protein
LRFVYSYTKSIVREAKFKAVQSLCILKNDKILSLILWIYA